ncbi:secreted protein [Streptomyces hygroscopicus subsp. jinggangensis 5008]|nr:secreted protein [Streptomyces hygroscopicus subsp. jinggangensis 5008]
MDPGKPGAYRTRTGEYSLKSVRLPGFSAPVEMRAVVVAPVGASGKRPLALFLHGRHYTCYKGQDSTSDWPCKAGAKPVPSHRGYLRDQKLLASQGYLTVSVSANGVNAQDFAAEDGGAQARSSLVRLHLARWADWAEHPRSAPKVVREAPRADLSRVLLVGHSRGGEGVNRAALDSLTPPPADQDGYHGPVRWHIRGTVLIAPTVFGQNPVPDVPSMTILPGCDGDVSDLQGEVYVDGTRAVGNGTALHSAVYVIGANHNFFNSEWTPGQSAAPAIDDFFDDPQYHDPVCGKRAATRLTADRQHRAGSTYIAAAARLFLAGDDRVRPLLDGSGKRAPSADPARVLSHAVGARRGGGFLPDAGVSVTGGRLCAAVDPSPARTCLGTGAKVSPHFAQWETDRETGRSAIALRWTRAGSPARVTVAKPVSLSGAKALALRLFVPPNSRAARLDVSLTDASGKKARLGRITPAGLPGSVLTASYWAQEIRVPLTEARRAGLDLRSVKSLELTPRSASGQAWLMDAWGWRPGTPAVRTDALPRVDIGRTTVDEGDSGVRTYRVPVQVTGRGGSGQVRVYVLDPATGKAADRLVTVRPGGHDIDVPVEVQGNTRYGTDVSYDVLVKAVRGAVVGSYRGGITVHDDDPAPAMTVTPVAGEVTEGQTLKWRVSLSEAVDVDMNALFQVAPATAPELSTKDVPAGWLRDTTGEKPDPERPLSKVTGCYLWVDIPAGRTSEEIALPTVKDGVRESTESVLFRQVDPRTGEPRTGGLELSGSVLGAS